MKYFKTLILLILSILLFVSCVYITFLQKKVTFLQDNMILLLKQFDEGLSENVK